MVWHAGNDDDPVGVVVRERLVVAAALGGVPANGRRRRDAAASAFIKQTFDGSSVLTKIATKRQSNLVITDTI